jgi:hypothetical protein
MIKWIFPQPGDSFLGWIGRLFLIMMGIIGFAFFLAYLDERNQPVDQPQQEWKGYDHTRPVSDISHRDYSTKTVYYREPGPYKGTINTEKWKTEGKYSDEFIEEIFLDNDLANDYEDLYEKYRD